MKNKREKNKPKDITPVKDTSPVIPQRDKIKNKLSIYEREFNEKQIEFLNIALDKDTKLMFISGPAGSAKTYMAVFTALKLLNEKRVSDLIYIRSAVESSDSKLGFLPGEAAEKMAPYLEPLIEKLAELLPNGEIEYLKKDGRISAIPVGFLRGLNWNAKAIIADEAQNLTYKELLTLITRTGEFSKVFVIGDPDQSDINSKSGFTKMMNVFDDEESKDNGIRTFRLTEDDIVRSGLVQFIIKKIKKAS
jgi:phosphate starvation-inducible PhoH-like protein